MSRGECPICGVPAMHGMSGLCSSPFCREEWEKNRPRRDDDDYQREMYFEMREDDRRHEERQQLGGISEQQPLL